MASTNWSSASRASRDWAMACSPFGATIAKKLCSCCKGAVSQCGEEVGAVWAVSEPALQDFTGADLGFLPKRDLHLPCSAEPHPGGSGLVRCIDFAQTMPAASIWVGIDISLHSGPSRADGRCQGAAAPGSTAEAGAGRLCTQLQLALLRAGRGYCYPNWCAPSFLQPSGVLGDRGDPHRPAQRCVGVRGVCPWRPGLAWEWVLFFGGWACGPCTPVPILHSRAWAAPSSAFPASPTPVPHLPTGYNKCEDQRRALKAYQLAVAAQAAPEH